MTPTRWLAAAQALVGTATFLSWGCEPSASNIGSQHYSLNNDHARLAIATSPTPPDVSAGLARAASVRRLQPARDVVVRRLSAAALAQRALELSLLHTTPTSREAELAFLQAFGLVPGTFDPSAALLELAKTSLLGVYDSESQVILLRDPPGADQARHELHEYVHALQDQHFGIGKRLSNAPGKGDATAALLSLAEGDATLAERVAQLAVSVEPEQDAPPQHLPRVVIDSSTATYADGLRFATAVYERGGWAALDAVWRDPPGSTEQLLHPEKYVSREPWRDIAPIRVRGCTLEYWDVVGEQGLRIVLQEWADERSAQSAAAGWDGDRAELHRCSDTLLVTWRIAFDAESDADEAVGIFADAAPPCDLSGTRWVASRRGTLVTLAAGSDWSCVALRDVLQAGR